MVALKAQIAQVNDQINAEAKHIADGLEAQVSVETGVIASLNNDLKRAQLAASTQTQDGVTLDSLNREAKAQRDLLDAYLLKYRDAAGRTDTTAVLPDVRVISQAAPSDVPASPKVTLIIAAVGIVSMVLQIGAILFAALMPGRARRLVQSRRRKWKPATGASPTIRTTKRKPSMVNRSMQKSSSPRLGAKVVDRAKRPIWTSTAFAPT